VDNDVVEQHQFVTLDCWRAPVLARWSYHPADPYAVTLAFRARHGRWIAWCFARDLLAEGLREPAGLGDVRVRPDGEFEDDLIVVELQSPDGHALVEARREDVERFVEVTARVVPVGAESERVDVDAFIARVNNV
jgi:sporulation and cell division protein SsgA